MEHTDVFYHGGDVHVDDSQRFQHPDTDGEEEEVVSVRLIKPRTFS